MKAINMAAETNIPKRPNSYKAKKPQIFGGITKQLRLENKDNGKGTT
jgi:hypothetical protein